MGAARLGLTAGGRANLADAQAAAAVGQIELAGAWAELLGQQGLVAAQLLLTLDDLDKAQEIGLDWWRYDRDLSPGGQRRVLAEHEAPAQRFAHQSVDGQRAQAVLFQLQQRDSAAAEVGAQAG